MEEVTVAELNLLWMHEEYERLVKSNGQYTELEEDFLQEKIRHVEATQKVDSDASVSPNSRVS